VVGSFELGDEASGSIKDGECEIIPWLLEGGHFLFFYFRNVCMVGSTGRGCS
jgi:hypothetical protein